MRAIAAAARAGRIARFREETREQRMAIADAAQERYGRSVAWGAACGDARELFTTLSVPVMTRLRQPERLVLDTLVDAGVARSRSEALAWAVRLVGRNADDLAHRAARRHDGGRGGPVARSPGRLTPPSRQAWRCCSGGRSPRAGTTPPRPAAAPAGIAHRGRPDGAGCGGRPLLAPR